MGAWKLELGIINDGTRTITTADFDETYNGTGSDAGLSYNVTGSMGALTGGAGEHLVSLNLGAIPYDFEAPNRLFTPGFFRLNMIMYIRKASGGFLDSATILQRSEYGGASIALPGVDVNTLAGYSRGPGADNIIFFG